MDIIPRIVYSLFVLSLVIFVHELGHFLVARWCGVLVERFSIGFGPVLASFRWGDTEYAISAIPLGGYVKMLGQSDTPHADEPSEDERSYQNKSVAGRMAIISAGVIMNLIFGFICFMIAYQIGVPYQPAIIGTTIPAKPAWQAGIRPGDNIVSINGQSPTDYELLLNEVALTTPPHESVRMTARRAGEELEFDVAPVKDAMKPMIGVLSGLGTKLLRKQPVVRGSAAAAAVNPGFRGGDRIVEIDGRPITSYQDIVSGLHAAADQPVNVRVEHERKKGDAHEDAQQKTVTVPPNFVRHVGIEMDIGEIVAVQDHSPAANAVDETGNPAPILPKDVIKAVDGVENLDPMRIPDVITAKAGKPVVLTVLRKGPELRELKLTVVPLPLAPWTDFPFLIMENADQPMSVPSIGIAYDVLSTVRKVDPAGPAADKIQPGDVVEGVTLVIKDDAGTLVTRAIKPKVPSEDLWPTAFWSMQFPDLTMLKLTVSRGSHQPAIAVDLVPTSDPTWPIWVRGMAFDADRLERREDTIAGAISAGLGKTRTSVVRLYLFLRGLIITRTISPQNLAGPITISTVTYGLTSSWEDFSLLLVFLGSLSINLAVINFLPIPVLDGGHMVFLLYELLTRRQASERAVMVAQFVGLAMIVALMIYVISLDVFRMIS